MLNKRTLGGRKEQLAGTFLEEKGYTVLEYNYRTRAAEIDLVCRDGNTFIFVEVKYRKDLSEGHPLEAVTAYKQGRIRRAALYYLMERDLDPEQTELRFDVVGILEDEVIHVENAF